MGDDKKVLITDVGMTPIQAHDIEPPIQLNHYARLYDCFAAPELPRRDPRIEAFPIAPSADIFSVGMLFIFLLLPITPQGEPSPEFQQLSQTLRKGDTPAGLPDGIVVSQPTAVLQDLWDLILLMLAAPERRPTSIEVLRKLECLRRCTDDQDTTPSLSPDDKDFAMHGICMTTR